MGRYRKSQMRGKTSRFFTLSGLALLLVSLMVGLVLNSVAAPPNPSGSLDGSFGSGGKLTTDFAGGPDTALGVAVQQIDGKIVAAGYAYTASGYDFALARYNPNGTLDSLGPGGKVTTDFGSPFDLGLAMALQLDGKIVVAGVTCLNWDSYSCYDSAFALARYNAEDGSLDPTFGSSGKVITNLVPINLDRETEVARAVALQSDGKIVVAGNVWNGSNWDFALVRYNPNGTLDTTSFGNGTGFVTTDFAGGFDVALSLAVQPSDGKIVAAGFANTGGPSDFALARYNPDGSLDATFGSSGKVTTDFAGSYDAAGAVALQVDGRIIAAGYAYTATEYDFALARYNTNGTLDTGFGTGGKVTTDFKRKQDIARGLALQSDGKIVAVGGATVAGFWERDFALARYNPNGTLDTSFNRSGKVTTDFAKGDDFAVSVALQPSDGKIVVAGFASTSGSTDFALARYLP